MANLPSIRLISREEIKEAPSWIDKLLSPLNTFMGSVYDALNRNLTFAQNIRCTIKELRFTTEADYVSADNFAELVFSTGLKVKAFGVTVQQLSKTASPSAVITAPTSIDWTERDGEIHVRFVAGLEDSTAYFIRFLVI